MEMASAHHGLALKLVEMNHLARIKNEHCEIISEEDKIIKCWFVGSSQTRFSKKDFFSLTRKTLLFVLSNPTIKELKRKDLLKCVSMYFHRFSHFLKSNLDIRKPLIETIVDPWKNTHFIWDELFQRRITFEDREVQQFFYAEPEEIVLARVHFFSKQGKDDMSMTLAKNSFLFHSRISRDLTLSETKRSSNPASSDSSNKKGSASMDWYLHNLRRKKSLPHIYNALRQLTCHEGVLLVLRLRQTRNVEFAFTVVEIFIMQELVQPSKYCCTKKLFSLWCLLFKEQKTPKDIILDKIRKMVALHAPTSAHFYLLVDTLWEQFGTNFITVYVELYIRGLTVDLNYLEAAKNGDVHDDVVYLESHIASMFYKLSTLFIDFHEGAARECMFSAFSLKPTKDRLCILQSLTLSILSNENAVLSPLSLGFVSSQECKCTVKCDGSCKSVKEQPLEHPILLKGIQNVPYSMVKDLVTVLESVRCIRFQYNVFDWRNNATDLGDYLRDFLMSRSWESETECASEGSDKNDDDNAAVSDAVFQPEKIDVEAIQSTVKRKIEASELKPPFSLDVGANIEVTDDAFINKRMKIDNQNKNTGISVQDILDVARQPLQNYGTSLGMEDAIENVIRMTLDNSRLRSALTSNNNPTYASTSLSHVSDGTEKLSLPSTYTPASENKVYPYSLTNYGMKNPANYKGMECAPPLKSEMEGTRKYPVVPTSTSSSLSRMLTSPPVKHEAVTSPTISPQTYVQMTQSKLAVKTASTSYNSSKDIPTSFSNVERNVPQYHQEALNLENKRSIHETKNISNTVSQSSQYTANQTSMQQALLKQRMTASDFSKPRYLPDKSAPCATPMNLDTPLNLVDAPMNLVRSETPMTAQSSQYPQVSRHDTRPSSFETSSRYLVDSSIISKTFAKQMNRNLFRDSQLVHRDRGSVIQHTMQHAKEGNPKPSLSKVGMPNQLAVSVNADAVEQIRNNPQKGVSNLAPFRVNVSDRSISNSSLAVSANLVIPLKPQLQTQVASQQSSNSHTPVRTSETITISGVLASPSVIVSPWETHRNKHGEMLYRKKIPAASTTSIDKKMSKNNRLPYSRHFIVKPEPRMVMSDKNPQVFKAVPAPSHISTSVHVRPSVNQSSASTSQNWSTISKSSQPSSSQPWYSEPYPKPFSSSNISSASVGTSASVGFNSSNISSASVRTISSDKNTPSTLKLLDDTSALNIFQPGRNDKKTYSNYPKQMQSSKNLSSPLLHPLHNPVSSSSPVSNVHSVSALSLSNPTSSTVTSILPKGYVVPSSSIKTYSMQNSSEPSATQSCGLQLRAEMVPATYAIPSVSNSAHQYSRALSRTCCSPSELNPCQNCSHPSENSLVPPSNSRRSNESPGLVLGSNDKMVLKSDLAPSVTCNSNFSYNNVGDELKNANAILLNCSLPISPSELQSHSLNCHSKELGEKNNFGINSSVLEAKNLSLKPIPDVGLEQNSLFERDSFHDDLPHTEKSYTEDKNLDEIDANAINACMDIINSDQDLKRIVQGIDSLNQISNNYMPFIPPEIQNNGLNEFANCDSYKIQENKLGEGKSFNSAYEFSNLSKSNLKTGRMSASTAKNQSELSFSAVSEMVKASISEDGSNVVKSIRDSIKEIRGNTNPISSNVVKSIHDSIREIQGNTDPFLKNTPKRELPKFECPYCLNTLSSVHNMKRHITVRHPGHPYIPPRKVLRTITGESSGNDVNKKRDSETSLNSSNNSPNNMFQSGDIDNAVISSPSEAGAVLPKGRPKGITKGQLTECQYCGKKLTVLYLKRHILKFHGETAIKTENIEKSKFHIGNVEAIKTENIEKSEFNISNLETLKSDSSSSDLNATVNLTQTLPVDSFNIQPLPPLLDQDIDSSTCLSVSDALKQCSSYMVPEQFHNSRGGSRLVEETNVKFNFDGLDSPKNEPNTLAFEAKRPSDLSESHLENLDGNSSFTEHVKDAEERFSCYVCNKSYHALGYLNRHLTFFHKILTPKPPKKSYKKKVSEDKKTDVERNQHTSCSQKVAEYNINSLNISTEKLNVPKEAGYVEKKTSTTAANFSPKVKEKYQTLTSPNSNKSLLKAVLQSNFERDRKELQENPLRMNSLHDKQTDICDMLKSVETDPRENFDTLSSTDKEPVEDLLYTNDMLDPKVNPNDIISTPVPFENCLEAPISLNSEECSQLLRHNTDVHYDSSSMQLPSLNNVPEVNTNSDIGYHNLVNSQNYTLQSGPISHSNGSGCNFLGNNHSENKSFEDNSHKLLLPKTHQELGNGNYQSNISEFTKVNGNQNNMYEQFTELSYQYNMDNVKTDYQNTIQQKYAEINDNVSSRHIGIKDSVDKESGVNDWQIKTCGKDEEKNIAVKDEKHVGVSYPEVNVSIKKDDYGQECVSGDNYQLNLSSENSDQMNLSDGNDQISLYSANYDQVNLPSENSYNKNDAPLNQFGESSDLISLCDKNYGQIRLPAKNDEVSVGMNSDCSVNVFGEINQISISLPEEIDSVNLYSENDRVSQSMENKEKENKFFKNGGSSIQSEENAHQASQLENFQSSHSVKIDQSSQSVENDLPNQYVENDQSSQSVDSDQSSQSLENSNQTSQSIENESQYKDSANLSIVNEDHVSSPNVNGDHATRFVQNDYPANLNGVLSSLPVENDENEKGNEQVDIYGENDDSLNLYGDSGAQVNLNTENVSTKNDKVNLYEEIDDQVNLPGELELKRIQDHSIVDSCYQSVIPDSEILLDEENNFSGECNVSFKKMLGMTALDCITGEGAALGNESSELENTLQNPDENYSCRVCKQNLYSDELLSKHLNQVHDIPVLTKPSTPKILTSPQEVLKLSPPKLKLGTHESDSESVSDFENTRSSSKATASSSDSDSYKTKTLSIENLCAIINSPILKQNGQDASVSLCNSPSIRTDNEESATFIVQYQKRLKKTIKVQVMPTKCNYRFRRIHSLDSIQPQPVLKSKTNSKNVQKGTSLPNIKLAAQQAILVPAKDKLGTTKLSEKENEQHSEENTSFGAVKDHAKSYKTSSDSSSSQSSAEPWNKIINSSFTQPNLPSASNRKFSFKKSYLRSKLSGRKLIIQRLKSYERPKRSKRKRKSKGFTRKKSRTAKIYKPFCTLTKATEIQRFLKTHKQPVVKLVRLTEEELASILNQNGNSPANGLRDKMNIKQPVVKLEKMDIASDKVTLNGQDLCVPNLLSQDAKSASAQIHNSADSSNSIFLDSSNSSSLSGVQAIKNLPDIEICDVNSSSSSDSVQFLTSITKREKRRMKVEFCPAPSTKECCVLLNRISV